MLDRSPVGIGRISRDLRLVREDNDATSPASVPPVLARIPARPAPPETSKLFVLSPMPSIVFLVAFPTALTSSRFALPDIALRNGSVTLMTVPWFSGPVWDSTETSPLWAWTTSFTMHNPSPTPVCDRVGDTSAMDHALKTSSI
eukprot:3143238-Rhodomonas_salina.2